MNTTPADEMILKTDVLGRVKTPAARREQLLDEFDRSGLNGRKFAELVGIKYQTFATWAQKRRRQRGAYGAVKAPTGTAAKSANTVRWLEAVMDQTHPSDGRVQRPLLVELPGGARMEVNDANQAALAATLLGSLAKSC